MLHFARTLGMPSKAHSILTVVCSCLIVAASEPISRPMLSTDTTADSDFRRKAIKMTMGARRGGDESMLLQHEAWSHVVKDGIERATSFHVVLQPGQRRKALQCLASAVYYESANQTDAGLVAVAQVVINRVRHPLYPNSICLVVNQGQDLRTGCQFTFTCDGRRDYAPSRIGWARAMKVAEAVLMGATSPDVGMATHYHTKDVRPYWGARLERIAIVGDHVFYRWPGRLGRRIAFSERYEGELAFAPGPSGTPNHTSIESSDPQEVPSNAVENSIGSLNVDSTLQGRPFADKTHSRLTVDTHEPSLRADDTTEGSIRNLSDSAPKS